MSARSAEKDPPASTPPESPVFDVLLVSDNDDFRAEVGEAFRAEGHRVHAFRSPAELAAASPIADLDVGIVDYTFGDVGETGLAIVDRLHASNRQLPLIVTTCHWTPHLGAECGRRWATFCLRKRCTGPEVVAVARDVVRSRTPARASRANPDAAP